MRHDVEVLFQVHRKAGSTGLTTEEAAAAYKAVTGKNISNATICRFREEHEGKFEKLKGNRHALRVSNVIPFTPKAEKMKNLSKVQQFVLDGYKKHAGSGSTGLTCDDLDKLLRQEDPDGLLGPVEKRRCNHASTSLKKLGLIEQCGLVGSGPARMGLYRATAPKPVGESVVDAQTLPFVQPEASSAKKGVVLRNGEWSAECPPDMAPEDIAKLMNELAATRRAGST